MSVIMIFFATCAVIMNVDESKIGQMRGGNAASAQRDEQRMQNLRRLRIHHESADPQQRETWQQQRERKTHTMTAVTVNHRAERQQTRAKNKPAFESMIGEKPKTKCRQRSENERQHRAMNCAQERCGGADAIGQSRETAAITGWDSGCRNRLHYDCYIITFAPEMQLGTAVEIRA
jgi:hypothetical protein